MKRQKLIVFSILTAAVLAACGKGGDDPLSNRINGRGSAANPQTLAQPAQPVQAAQVEQPTAAPIPTIERQSGITAPPTPPTAWVVVVTAEPPPVIVSPVETVQPAQPCAWRTVTPYDAGGVNPNDVIAGFCD